MIQSKKAAPTASFPPSGERPGMPEAPGRSSLPLLCHDFCDARIRDHPRAHRARLDLPAVYLAVFLEVITREVQRGTDRLRAGCTQERVHLSVDRRARAIVSVVMLAALSKASMQVTTVRLSTGGTVIPRSNDLVIGDDNGAVTPPEAGRPSADCFRDLEVVCIFTRPQRNRPCSQSRCHPSRRPGHRRSPRGRSA